MILNKMGARHSVTEYALAEMILNKMGARHSVTEYALAEMIPLFSLTEYALAEMIPKYPHLVKLGVRLEFRQGQNIDFATCFDKF